MWSLWFNYIAIQTKPLYGKLIVTTSINTLVLRTEFSTSSGLLHHPLRSRYELKRLANYPRVEKTKLMSAIVKGKKALLVTVGGKKLRLNLNAF